MNKTAASILIERVRRVCLFDASVYQDTRKSLFSACLIVLLVAVSHGVGGVIRAKINNWDPQESFVFALQGEIIFWLVQSLVYYLIAKMLLHKPVKPTEVLSSVGFAIFPGILVFAAALLQMIELSVPMLIILAIYRLATCTAALQQLLSIKRLHAFILVVVGTAIGFFCLGMAIRITTALTS